MADVKDGFKVTLGIVLAILFAIGCVIALFVILTCGGCAAVVGVGAVAVDQAKEVQQKAQGIAKKQAEEAAKAAIADPLEAVELPVQNEAGALNQDVEPAAMPPELPEDPKPGPVDPTPLDSPNPNPEPEKPAAAASHSAKPKGPSAKVIQEAERAYDLARRLMDKPTSATAGKARMREIVEQYPGTPAAAKAAKLLGE